MANVLSPDGWKKFLKTCPGLKDPDLLTKALDKYDPAAAPNDRVARSMKVVEQAKAVQKKNAKNTALDKHVGKLIEEAEAELKKAEAEAKEKEGKDDEGPEDNLKGMLKIARMATRDKALG